MKTSATSIGVVASILSGTVAAQAVDFEADAVGAQPAGWTCGVTGRGTPHWQVGEDAGAPSARHVLQQTGSGTFPWCVKSGTAVGDGFVEEKLKPISGKEDRAGGVVWRWQDGDHYYVARANALENNVSLYYTERGSRNTIKYVDAPVQAGVWHTLRVEFAGTRIAVSVDGKRYIDLD
ncbi:MAG TPA: hypothetical protein VGK95_07350, partial [Caldimonas sp.]